jgi:hypothetical protein
LELTGRMEKWRDERGGGGLYVLSADRQGSPPNLSVIAQGRTAAKLELTLHICYALGLFRIDRSDFSILPYTLMRLLQIDPSADHHHLVKWVLRYSTEDKGR